VKLVRAAVLLVLITSLTFSAFGQNKGVQNAHADANDMRGLIISGQGFVFLASEPQGWDTDTGKAATEYSVNAIFFPRVQVSRSHHVTIRVRLNQKTTEDPNEDMRGDVNDYKKRYPSTKFADLDFKHPNYKTCAKLFYTQGHSISSCSRLHCRRKNKLQHRTNSLRSVMCCARYSSFRKTCRRCAHGSWWIIA